MRATKMVNKLNSRSGIIGKFVFIWSASGQVARENGISRLKQFIDILILVVLRQLGPKLYFEARLWRPTLSWAFKLGFMTQKRYYHRVKQLNPPAYHKLSQHKQAEKALFRLLNIPSADYIGFYHPTTGSTLTGEPLNNEKQLTQLFDAHQNQKLCFKPAEGYGGKGFIAALIVAHDTGIRLQRLNADVDESVQSFSEHYLSNPGGYVIEQYFTQHPLMAEMNPSSVNTVRIWVRQRDQDISILGAVQRLGRKGSLVDNSTDSGLLVYVDPELGILGLGRTTDIFPEYFEFHPDSFAKITGRQLPHWPACIELAKRTLRSFPKANFAGLDLAIGERGPIVIEMNLNPDKISVRIFDKSHKELLG